MTSTPFSLNDSLICSALNLNCFKPSVFIVGLVYAPDNDSFTSGKLLYEAIFMARDLFGTVSLNHEAMPLPSTETKARTIAAEKADEPDFKYSDAPISLIDIDTDEYRRKLDTRAVKKNCTLPAWLNEKTEAANINFSRVLQEAIMHKLGLQRRH